ncbi:MAG: glycoside hydrolase family 127 protein, partial [Clostridiales bacterium]|nr:glycoside hydrolase family 127 protein [Clostridiales bacterium]
MEKFIGKPVSFDRIDLIDGFWKEKQDLFRKVTINAVYDRFEETGRFEALKFNWKEGMPNKPHIFWESDVTKWIEGAAYFLQKQRDPELEAKVDELVQRMVDTQGEDGYLNAYFTVVEPEARFTRRTDHELYCAGHLVEGAIA